MVIYEYDVMQNCFPDTHENNDNDRIGKEHYIYVTRWQTSTIKLL